MRILGLDLLRIIAVILVIGRHLHIPENGGIVLHTWQKGGWVGVDLFFVLSGFLVSSLLFREHIRFGAVDIKRFLIRRGFKIYPAFWLFLTFSLLMRVLLKENPTILEVIGELFFFQNYLGGLWNHTWSLAVEEHFYLGLAALVTCLIFITPKDPFKLIPSVFATVSIACLSFRFLNLAMFPEYSFRAYLYGTHIRIDSLMFGVFLAYLCNFLDLERRSRRLPSFLLVICGLLFLSPAFLFTLEADKWISILGVVLFYWGSGLLILAAMRLKSSESAPLKILSALGAASYSIYLWHMPVATWGYDVICEMIGFDNYYVYLLNSIVGACIFGWILNRLIERPVLSLRNRLFPSNANALIPGVQCEAHVAADAKDDFIVLGELKVEHLKFAAYLQSKSGPDGRLTESIDDPLKQPLFIVNGEFVEK